MMGTNQRIGKLSDWIDDHNKQLGKDSEAMTWGRLAKVFEEGGEVIKAYIGATGQNPRKGFYATMEEVEEELLDVALTALAALHHLQPHGDTMNRFEDFVESRCQRVGL